MIKGTWKRVVVAPTYDKACQKIVETYTETAKNFTGVYWSIEVSPPQYDENFVTIIILIHVDYGKTV